MCRAFDAFDMKGLSGSHSDSNKGKGKGNVG